MSKSFMIFSPTILDEDIIYNYVYNFTKEDPEVANVTDEDIDDITYKIWENLYETDYACVDKYHSIYDLIEYLMGSMTDLGLPDLHNMLTHHNETFLYIVRFDGTTIFDEYINKNLPLIFEDMTVDEVENL